MNRSLFLSHKSKFFSQVHHYSFSLLRDVFLILIVRMYQQNAFFLIIFCDCHHMPAEGKHVYTVYIPAALSMDLTMQTVFKAKIAIFWINAANILCKYSISMNLAVSAPLYRLYYRLTASYTTLELCLWVVRHPI